MIELTPLKRWQIDCELKDFATTQRNLGFCLVGISALYLGKQHGLQLSNLWFPFTKCTLEYVQENAHHTV